MVHFSCSNIVKAKLHLALRVCDRQGFSGGVFDSELPKISILRTGPSDRTISDWKTQQFSFHAKTTLKPWYLMNILNLPYVATGNSKINQRAGEKFLQWRNRRISEFCSGWANLVRHTYACCQDILDIATNTHLLLCRQLVFDSCGKIKSIRTVCFLNLLFSITVEF